MTMSVEYLTGFFDGEGCINIYAREGGRSFRLRLMLTNTNLEVLRAVQKTYGGNLQSNRATARPTHRLRHQLIWISQRAADLLLIMRPHSIVKRAEIDLVLNEFVPSLQEHGRGPGRHQRNPDNVVEFRRELKQRLSAMKRVAA